MKSQPLHEEAQKMHEIMCLAAVVIFPLFAVFDYYTIPPTVYWPLTAMRIFISASIGTWLFLQHRRGFRHEYLSAYAFTSISWFCCFACVYGGRSFLYQHNIAYCTVFLAASLFMLWNWLISLAVVFSSFGLYVLLIYLMGDFTFLDFSLEGGAALLTIMVLHPLIVYYRFQSFKRENTLKAALKESYRHLLLSKEETEERNQDLLFAREKLNTANQELKQVNQHLEDLVYARTNLLEMANKELKDASEELDQFFYSSFHDLKGPVARVKGLALLTQNDAPNSSLATYGELMLKTAIEMERMVQRFNKINEIHQISPQYFPLKVHEFFSAQTMGEAFKEVFVELHIDPELSIRTDPRLLQTISENILDNSLRYREEHRPLTLTIRTVTVGTDLQLIFYDNGSGIKPTVIDQVFLMFFRGNEKSQGHGLGLYLVKKSVEKLNSVVEIKSTEGEHTQVRIILPDVVGRT
jgi:signal transduction histidine kinase